jgi:translation initiation factor eIF-2B subunit gamma
MNSKTKNIDISIVDVFILIIDDTTSMKDICNKKKKSFLPVMNKPILFYQLEFLERQNIKEVHLLFNKEDLQKEIVSNLASKYKGSIKLDLIETSMEVFEIFNTIKSNITKNNFLLIEGDSIISFNLGDFIDNHIDNKNLVTLILQKKESELTKMKFLREDTLDNFGIDFDDNNRVVYYYKKKSGDTEYLSINKKRFNNCTNFNLLMNYMDLGFYIFNYSIFDVLDFIKSKIEKEKSEKRKNLLKSIVDTIKDDFIPYLIKKSFWKDLNMALIEKYNNELLKVDRIRIGSKLIDNEKNIKSDYCYKIYDYPSYLTIIEEIQKSYDDIRPIFFQTKNNEKNYFMNFADKIRDNLENNKRYNDGIPEIEFITSDSYIADKIENIDKSVKINKTVADKKLKVLEGTKMNSCVIGENASIGKNCRLTNCIIGESAVIGDNCAISDCVIADNYNISEKTNASEKILSNENEDLNFN